MRSRRNRVKAARAGQHHHFPYGTQSRSSLGTLDVISLRFFLPTLKMKPRLSRIHFCNQSQDAQIARFKERIRAIGMRLLGRRLVAP